MADTTLKKEILAQLTATAKKTLASRNDMDARTANAALGNAVTAILAGLQSNTQDENGAQALDAELSKKHDGSILDDLLAAVKDDGVQADGAKILGHIFGNNQDKVKENLARTSGINASAVSDILTTLAPIVLGQLGKTKRTEGLDAAGLAEKLLQQSIPKTGAMRSIMALADRNKNGRVLDDLLNLGGVFGKGSYK